MGMTAQEQLETAINALSSGDIDLMERLLTEPDSVTIKDQRTVAQRLGIKRGLLSAFVNTASDPTVWLATWMSRVFPTSSWLRGTIPQRFIGSHNEFTGLSYVARPVEGFFRGSNIPRLVALAQYRQAEVMKVGRRMFDRFEGRPGWRDEMPIVSLMMEGQAPSGATPALKKIADALRGDMNELWGFMRQTQKVTGGFEGTEVTRSQARSFSAAEAPRFLRDYLPHIPLGPTRESVIRVGGKDALRRMSGGFSGQAMQAAGERVDDVWRPDATDRLASNFGRYQQFLNRVRAQVFNDRMFKRQRMNLNLQGGEDLFVTDLNIVLQKYLHSVSRTYATNAPISEVERRLVMGSAGASSGRLPSNEPIVTQIINEGLDLSGGKFLTSRVPGSRATRETLVAGSDNGPMRTALRQLVRNVQGESNEHEILTGNLFSAVRNKVSAFGRRVTGRAQLNEIDAALQTIERNRTSRQLSNGLASYFYATTLGLNVRSALQNLMQPVLTTMPAIGIGPTLSGMRVLKERMPAYFRNFRTEHQSLRGGGRMGFTGRTNLALERAFEKTFPELGAQGIRLDPRLFDIDESALIQSRTGKRFRSIDDFNKFILQAFTQTEGANQVTTFFGAKKALMNHARTGEFELPRSVKGNKIVAGAELDDYLNFEAGQVVGATQFRPGAGTRSVIQNMLPAPLRQFQSFTTRYASHLADSTVRGAMSNAQIEQTSILRTLSTRGLDALNPLTRNPDSLAAQRKLLSLGTGRNMGTVARTLIYSKIVVNGLRETLGVDVGGALGLTSPLQVAPANQIFAPIPMPPAASVVFAVVGAATTRDFKRLQALSLPGLGEIPIPKTLFPGGVALTRVARAMQQFRPDMGGFVDDDERLMYRGGTTDAILAALGIPLEKQRRSREVIERVHANRNLTRRFRRRYAVAAMGYDTDEMDALSAKWSKAFPDMPPLAVSGKDLRRYNESRRLPAAQRMIRTLGGRGAYLEAELYEFDPDLIAPPSPLEGLFAA